VEKVWKELQLLMEDEPSAENRAKEDELFFVLLNFLSDPQAPQDLTLKWYTPPPPSIGEAAPLFSF